MNIKRIEILGVPVDDVTMPGALGFVEHAITAGRKGAILAVNPEKVMRARQDPELLGCLRSAALLIPDGMGVVVAARILGLAHMPGRVPGADLMQAICAQAADRGYKVFLFGAKPEVNEKARDVLQRTYPGLAVVGGCDGYMKAEDMPALVKRINDSGADILFIALGSPRQEQWIARYLPSLRVKICQGVGGTFDVIAGAVRRAPRIFQAANLEWAYRLLSQPSRLLRQTALPRFAWKVMVARFARSPPRA